MNDEVEIWSTLFRYNCIKVLEAEGNHKIIESQMDR